MFQGVNPLLNNDRGNYVAELADGQGASSVRILILGVDGDQLRFAGIGRPMFENLLQEGFPLFDLRGFLPDSARSARWT
jgi:hypothetical protein